MHGGVKFYRGSPSAARTYVEADRARVDDYYLAEGTGLATRHVVTVTDGVATLGPARELDGAAYELWVGGYDVATGEPKGRLRNDDNALRFVEVVVNGPKSWSLAASLHPEIATAYDAAQDHAAGEIIGWLAEHATTRIGPRGRQVQVPVEQLEAAVVRHHTSRAGDPHRHLHLQINARVYAAGAWRGLHSVGVVDSINAINGIGHAAVMCDPDLRQALAAHGYQLDPATGEVEQLAPYAGPFSARTAQIARNVDRYEAAWRTEHPGQEPGLSLRRSWDRRAWAQARPDKVVPRDGRELTQRWTQELHDLGFRVPDLPVRTPEASPAVGVPVSWVNRDAVVDLALTRLGAARSAWNAADIRGQVEQIVAGADIVALPAARRELAEDLVARGIAASVPLLDRPDVPGHVRSLTSQQVLDVEDQLIRRLAARGQRPGYAGIIFGTAEGRLDAPQRLVAETLAGSGALVVVEGPAGAGKTTTLAAVKDALAYDRLQLVIVTPTLKAARVAEEQVGVPAHSAGSLIHQYGFRWDADGHRHRVGPSERRNGGDGVQDGVRLVPGDLLLVDEAGMLDQDTALALATIADETGARLALVGDRHQLPAVGRGGVLDLADRWAHPSSRLELDTVHRFADAEFADLSLLMRTGERAGDVFDALLARGEVVVHATDVERDAALAAVDGLIIADTRDQVRTLNAAIRDTRTRPVADTTTPSSDYFAEGATQGVPPGGTSHGTPGGTLRAAPDTTVSRRTVATAAGEDLGAGDLVTTRRNDRDLDVANRDTWTVTAVNADGTLKINGPRGPRTLPADYAATHVELAYATTVHGAQGQTVEVAHLAIGDTTGAASAYVGMTRGRHHNTAHLVAPDADQARAHWIRVFTRDRADLGPRHAATRAANDIETHGPSRPRVRAPEPTSYSKPKPSRGVPR